MTNSLRWLIATLSSTLEPELRESIVGDLTELRVSRAKTIYEILGLIMRQQARLWREWRPWLVLIGIVGASGWQLSSVCLGLISDITRRAFVYWQYGVPYNSGLTGTQEIEIVVCTSFAVACWSWLAGFTLVALSRKTAIINGTLFCLAWFSLCGPLGFLVYLACLVLNAMGLVVLPQAVTFSTLSFFAMVHLLLATLLLLIPSLVGMRRSLRDPKIGRPFALLFSAILVALTTLIAWMQGWQRIALQKWSEGKWDPGGPSLQQRLVPLLVLGWPIVCLLATQGNKGKEKPTIG